jgi:5-methylcytosine-specific restriction endonuclease McrA
MGLKKSSKSRKKRDHAGQGFRVHGNSRSRLILQIVLTDNTFCLSVTDGSSVGKCIHCSSAIYVDATGKTNGTIEHIIPITAGGSGSDMLNLALACASCNSEKGIRHDRNYHRNQRSAEVIEILRLRRQHRWRPDREVI